MMLHRLLPILTAALLLFIPACAEPAEDAAPAENLFYGTWQLTYLVQDGKLVTDDEDLPTMFVFDEESVTAHYPNDDLNQSSCEYTGSTCSAWDGETHFSLEGEDLIVGNENGYSFILTRIDPLLLNNPFLGTWFPVCLMEEGIILDSSQLSENASVYFAASVVQLFDEYTVDTYPCIYADGACMISIDDENTVVCTISENGLLHMVNPVMENAGIICVPENEVIPDEVSQFFGAWREITSLRSGLLLTDQMLLDGRPGEQQLYQYEFSRVVAHRFCPGYSDALSDTVLCSYAGGTCTISYEDSPALCTIDENGLMCIRSEDGLYTAWLLRADEETAEESIETE